MKVKPGYASSKLGFMKRIIWPFLFCLATWSLIFYCGLR